MPFRIISFDGAGYRTQHSKKNHIGYPRVSAVLYYGSRRWKSSRKLKDHLKIPEELKKYVSDYRIHVFEISFLAKKEINCFHSDFRYVADYFAGIRENPEYRGSDAELVHVDEVLKLISAMSGRPYEGRAREKIENGEIKTMKNVIEELLYLADAKAGKNQKAETAVK